MTDSNRSARLLLGGLALALLAGLGFWLSSLLGGGSAPADGPTRIDVADVGGGGARSSAALVDGSTAGSADGYDSGLVSDEANRTAITEARADQRPAIDESNAYWIEGRVIQPPGAPDDPTCKVVVLEKRGRAERPTLLEILMGKLDIVESMAKRADVVLNDTHLKPDGTFALAVPKGARAPHIDVVGRYARLVQPLPVRVGSEPLEVELAPELGSWLRGSVAPQGDTQTNERLMRGGIVWLIPDTTSNDLRRLMDPFDSVRYASLDINGEFEFGGVEPDRPWTVVAQPPALAMVQESQIRLRPGEERELELLCSRAASVTGTVTDDDGRPVGGALVEIEPKKDFEFGDDELGMQSLLKRRATTLPDGTYAIGGIEPGEMRIGVEKEGYRKRRFKKVELEAGQALANVDIVLRAGRYLAGRVEWSDGTPIAGAKVEAFKATMRSKGLETAEVEAPDNPLETRSVRDEAVSDEFGNFVIRGLNIGTHAVVAMAVTPGADGRLRTGFARIEKAKPSKDDLVLVLEEVSSYGGTVVDARGRPVEKFIVKCVERGKEDSPLGQMFSAVATNPNTFEGRDGQFRALGLEDGEWSFVVEAEGFTSSRPHPFDIPRDLEGARPKITLQPDCAIVGVVLTPDGLPAAGATVRMPENSMVEMSRMFSGDVDTPHAIAGPGGEFELTGLDGGRIILIAESSSATPSIAQPFDVVPGQTLEGAVFRLRRGGSVTGELIGRDGAPVENTEVELSGSDFGDDMEVDTDGAGRFRFDHIPVGDWRVSARLPEVEGRDLDWNTRNVGESIEVLEGQNVHVVLGGVLENEIRLFGRVMAGDSPVSSMLTIRLTDAPDDWSQSHYVEADEEGNYEVTLHATGNYTVSVSTEGNWGGSRGGQYQVDVPAVEEFEFHIDLPLGRISGHVYGPDGQPAEGVSMNLLADGRRKAGFDLGPFGGIQTEEDGSYEFNYLEPGEYSIQAGGAGRAFMFGSGGQFGKELRSGLVLDEGTVLSGIDFQLRTPGQVEGTVVDSKGLPVQGANVFARAANGELVDALSGVRSDAAGSFRYGGLAPGSYTFSARDATRASTETAPIAIGDGEARRIEIEVVDATTLSIVVRDAAGGKIKATVEVDDSAGRPVDSMVGIDGIGSFFRSARSRGAGVSDKQVGPLPPGEYTVRATRGDEVIEKHITLRGATTEKIELVFTGG